MTALYRVRAELVPNDAEPWAEPLLRLDLYAGAARDAMPAPGVEIEAILGAEMEERLKAAAASGQLGGVATTILTLDYARVARRVCLELEQGDSPLVEWTGWTPPLNELPPLDLKTHAIIGGFRMMFRRAMS